MGSVKVSIVIPDYNQAHFLRSSIQSALSQTCKDYEIIVVDDGSVDDSRSVVSEYGHQVKYIWQENKGLAEARNTGIRVAQGKFIGLLDADDEWMPTYLEEMMQLVEQQPGAAVYYCRAQAIDEAGNVLPQVFGGPACPPEDLYERILRSNFIIPSTVLMRRSVIESAGLFDPGLRSCEDWDLWLRLSRQYEIVGIDDILVKYRIHGSSLSTNSEYMKKASCRVIEKNFGMEDGKPDKWLHEKRKAYCGLYRYHTIISIQRQGDWERGLAYLFKAVKIDPTIAYDLDFFYELALGTQSAGYRGTLTGLQLKKNNEEFFSTLQGYFQNGKYPGLEKLKRKIKGTAYYAFGLVGYNTDQYSLTRPNLVNAFLLRPSLLIDPLFRRTLVKSLLGVRLIKKMKKLKKDLSD